MRIGEAWWRLGPGTAEALGRGGVLRCLRVAVDRDAPVADFDQGLDAITALAARLADGAIDRTGALRRVAAAHGPQSLPADRIAGLPPRLFELVLDRMGTVRAPAVDATLPATVEEGLPAPGARRGLSVEWWGLPVALGAAYGSALWAWGSVDERGAARQDLSTVSPRACWTPTPTGWRVHDALRGVVGPRLAEGPGLLLAAACDAVSSLAEVAAFTDRDRAMLWASLLGPALAPAQRGSPTAGVSAANLAPDYVTLWAFQVLHPRARAAIAVVDALATRLASDDGPGLEELARAVGSAAEEGPEQAAAVLDALAASVGHRKAAEAWDSGFGYRLVRDVIETARGSATDPAALDALLHGAPDGAEAGDETALGAFATRLRRALKVALAFPGRDGARYPGGSASRQLLDLVWLDWTDPDYLA